MFGGDNMINTSLKHSLSNHKVIIIVYMKGLEITQRKIQVLKMNDKIIRALDIEKGQLRTFKIENILSAIDAKLIDDREDTRGIYYVN